MRYRNIIWDFDGTLFDTYPGMCRSLRQAMESIGIRVTEEELLPRFLVSMRVAIEYCAEQGKALHINELCKCPAFHAMQDISTLT